MRSGVRGKRSGLAHRISMAFKRHWPTLLLTVIIVSGLFGARQMALAAAAMDMKAGVVAVDGELVKRPVQVAQLQPSEVDAGRRESVASPAPNDVIANAAASANTDAMTSASSPGDKPAGDNFDFFSDKPVVSDDVVTEEIEEIGRAHV